MVLIKEIFPYFFTCEFSACGKSEEKKSETVESTASEVKESSDVADGAGNYYVGNDTIANAMDQAQEMYDDAMEQANDMMNNAMKAYGF